jgi:hypothetical protein
VQWTRRLPVLWSFFLKKTICRGFIWGVRYFNIWSLCEFSTWLYPVSLCHAAECWWWFKFWAESPPWLTVCVAKASQPSRSVVPVWLAFSFATIFSCFFQKSSNRPSTLLLERPVIDLLRIYWWCGWHAAMQPCSIRKPTKVLRKQIIVIFWCQISFVPKHHHTHPDVQVVYALSLFFFFCFLRGKKVVYASGVLCLYRRIILPANNLAPSAWFFFPNGTCSGIRGYCCKLVAIPINFVHSKAEAQVQSHIQYYYILRMSLFIALALL